MEKVIAIEEVSIQSRGDAKEGAWVLHLMMSREPDKMTYSFSQTEDMCFEDLEGENTFLNLMESLLQASTVASVHIKLRLAEVSDDQ